MPHGSHAASRRVAARRRAWRGATFVSAVGGGLLFLTSWATSGGNEIRAASVTDLRTLVQRQRADTDAEVAKAAALADEVRTLSRSRGGAQVRRWQNEIDKVSPAAGLNEATGPGMTITLSDAPQSVVQLALKNGTPEIEKLVVHQQDIQAVINALWIGGATAVSVQDQRIISTTGIKCVGATVILHGVPYSMLTDKRLRSTALGTTQRPQPISPSRPMTASPNCVTPPLRRSKPTDLRPGRFGEWVGRGDLDGHL